MYGKIKQDLGKALEEIREAGLYKEERVITGPQGVEITIVYASHVNNAPPLLGRAILGPLDD